MAPQERINTLEIERLFADRRADLLTLADAVSVQAGADPAGQGDLLQRWANVTREFTTSQFWASAADVHAASGRADAAAEEYRASKVAASVAGNAAARASEDVEERNRAHRAAHPHTI